MRRESVCESTNPRRESDNLISVANRANPLDVCECVANPANPCELVRICSRTFANPPRVGESAHHRAVESRDAFARDARPRETICPGVRRDSPQG
eukprot:5612544-Prymnesium_polylepis.1